MILPPEFYQHSDVVSIARSLLGKVLVSEVGGIRTEATIVETEAYRGSDDRACHAYLKKRTPRTETMFLNGGHAYVYLCYGMHHLFNVVTNLEGEPDAVLIRAAEPVAGHETMMERRKMKTISKRLMLGPGCLSQALGIDKHLNSKNLTIKGLLWIEDRNFNFHQDQIGETTRIGVEYAGEDALRPWRFYILKNKWVSYPPKNSN